MSAGAATDAVTLFFSLKTDDLFSRPLKTDDQKGEGEKEKAEVSIGPLLFLIYINDLIDICSTYSEVYVFADDAKFFRHILSATDSNNLQYAVDALQKWSTKWLLNLNI